MSINVRKTESQGQHFNKENGEKEVLSKLVHLLVKIDFSEGNKKFSLKLKINVRDDSKEIDLQERKGLLDNTTDIQT